jgi:hypothetical protein
MVSSHFDGLRFHDVCAAFHSSSSTSLAPAGAFSPGQHIAIGSPEGSESVGGESDSARSTDNSERSAPTSAASAAPTAA